MADFARWASACELASGQQDPDFLKAYQANRADGRNLALESSPPYEPLLELAREGSTGGTAELLARLNTVVSENVRPSVRWPKAPNALTNSLRRMAGNLRSAGIELQFSRADRLGRRIVSVNAAVSILKRSLVISASSDR